MLGSDAPVVVGGLVAVALVVLTVTAAAWAAWRAARRRWRMLHGHPVVRSAAALCSLARAVRPPAPPTRRAGWTSRGSTALLRHDLWRTVGAAERAVRQAAVAGGAVGELPTLARRLHGVALDLDRLLAMGDGIAPGSSGLNEARRQMVAVVEAANDIRSAAVASAGDAARTRVLSLTEDADREVRSLAAGLARARAAFPARQSA